MANGRRGRFVGQSSRALSEMARRKLTHSVTLRPPTTALRKVYSITSSAIESTSDGTSMPSARAVCIFRQAERGRRCIANEGRYKIGPAVRDRCFSHRPTNWFRHVRHPKRTCHWCRRMSVLGASQIGAARSACDPQWKSRLLANGRCDVAKYWESQSRYCTKPLRGRSA
jgi:hypothetical protein